MRELIVMLRAHLSVWTDETGEAHDAAIGEQFGHLADSADILLAVLWGKAEVLVEAVSDVVSIQAVCRDALRHEVLLQGEGDGRFTGSRQP